MNENTPLPTGLSSAEAKARQSRYGFNELTPGKKESFLRKALEIVREPMFLLLIAAATIYFLLGEPRDGAIMLIFVVGIISIDLIQEWKTDKTLNALKDLSAPHIPVIRDGVEKVIASRELVPGDLMLLEEGVKIPADGTVIRCNDLCVDESSLTGEAEGVWKINTDDAPASGDYWRKDYCYAGTLVTRGTGTIRVDKIGAATEYGKIGANIAAAPEEETPLQKQTGSLVKLCAIIAAGLFVLVGIFTWLNIPDHEPVDRLIESVLSGVTLAMAMIPEEFPVILTVFLSMGAWRLAKKHSLVRRLPGVETLGAVSVLCVDKTGTITVNRMTVTEARAANGDGKELLTVMGMACETEAYDPMEKAMLKRCAEEGISGEELFRGELVTEYSFTDETKMMGHVWRKDGEIRLAAKGSPESILSICHLGDGERASVETQLRELSSKGLRVIAVGTQAFETEKEIPEKLTDCRLTYMGLIGLMDPPREGIREDIETCRRAGIRVVMITGDNGFTASAIAGQIGMEHADRVMTGAELNDLSDEELREKVKDIRVFSRVIPEHKMRIVKALKENGEVVAMTGDGVNDAPALKYADIGIAMGKRGSEVSREAADLILMDDNFTTIVETVKDGRRIYDNIRKAVGYIFTIHIPIAFTSLLAPMLGIAPAAFFLLPLHVVLMELLIDPTCSVVLERQPAEEDIMERKPRDPKEKILTARTLIRSVAQGLVIFAASFLTYYVRLNGTEANAPVARSMGLTILMLANLFLVLVNSSERDFAFRSMKKLARDKVMWAIILATLAGIGIILYTPLAGFLKLSALPARELLLTVGIAVAAVFWIEGVKLAKKLRNGVG